MADQTSATTGYASIRSASLAATGSIAVNTVDASTVGVQITGTWAGVVQFEGTNDDNNWNNVPAYAITTAVAGTSTTRNGHWRVNVAGLKQFRVRCSTYTSGTIQVDMHPSLGRMEAIPFEHVRTSSEARPTNPQANDRLYETDTRREWLFDGSDWKPRNTAAGDAAETNRLLQSLLLTQQQQLELLQEILITLAK